VTKLRKENRQEGNYQTTDEQGKAGERKLTEFLVRHGQALLPMMELNRTQPQWLSMNLSTQWAAPASKPCSISRPRGSPDPHTNGRLVRRTWCST